MPTAQPPRDYYKRKLPHAQNGICPLFVSMSTRQHLFLPPAARTIVLEHVLRENQQRINLHCAVIMPDHVHLLFTIRADGDRDFPLADVMHGIRGPSAHRVNKLLARKGAVWEEEFFDRLVRFGEFEKTVEYICFNPVKGDLVKDERDYPWLWVAPYV